MNSNLTAQIVLESLRDAAMQRYDSVLDGDDVSYLCSLHPNRLSDFGILRLKRSSHSASCYKTIAVNVVENPSEFHESFRWLASMKEVILDPESSDLYFVGAIKNEAVSKEMCITIESGEQFCRKYVMRPEEEMQSFIDRTFLSNLNADELNDDITDPLIAAISKTSLALPEFEEELQKHWQSALLSGKAGADIANDLFSKHPSSNNTDATP